MARGSASWLSSHGRGLGPRDEAAIHGVAKSRTRLSDFTFTFHFHALEKEMATHSSVFACRIPGMGVGLALGSPIFPSSCKGRSSHCRA